MKKSAFTLIELLVVITIIAILAGIALPVFTGVQEKALAMKDANNLKQIGIASMSYFNDHDDTIFVSGTSFATLLNPKYIGVWKSFQSPFDKRTASETAASAPVSYDLNINLLGQSCSDVVSPSNCILVAPLLATFYPNITFSGLPSSAPTLTRTSNSSGVNGGTHLKGKRINVLFQDAHVEPILMSDFHSPMTNTDTTTASRVTDLRWNPLVGK